MRKKVLLFVVLMFALLLSACWPAEVAVTTTINGDGSGTRVYVIDIYDDTLSAEPIANPEDPDGTKGKGAIVNDWHINGGLNAIQTWLEENAPDFITIGEVTVDGVHRYFTFSFDFKDFDDFLDKYEALVNLSPNLSWDDFDDSEKPKLTVENQGFNRILTFTESKAIVEASLDWAIDGIFNDLYNAQGLDDFVGKADIWALANYTIKLGDETFEELSFYDPTRPDGDFTGKIVFVESEDFSLEATFSNTVLLVGVIVGGVAVVGGGGFALYTFVLKKK